MERMSQLNAVEAEQKKQEAVTSLQQRLPEAEKTIKAANGKVYGHNRYKAELQAVLIIHYHKGMQQVLKSTIKKPELALLFENCVNVSEVLPPGAAGGTRATFDQLDFGGAMEEEGPTLNNRPNFDSSIDL